MRSRAQRQGNDGVGVGVVRRTPHLLMVAVVLTLLASTLALITPSAPAIAAPDRVTDDLLVLYEFLEGSGDTVADTSGNGTPLNLTIANPGNTSWTSGGGLSIDSPTVVSSSIAAAKISSAVVASDEITVEAWVAPANTTQTGPARIVSMSADSTNRNFTLGQDADVYNQRLRTTATDSNGEPPVTSPSSSVSTAMTHVVYTRDNTGAAVMYLDGSSVTTDTVNSPTCSTFRRVSFLDPVRPTRCGAKAMNGGFDDTTVKKENGARLVLPSGSTVATSAIGRGITTSVNRR